MYSFTVVLESKIYSVGIDSALINFDRVIDPCLNERVDIVPIGLALIVYELVSVWTLLANGIMPIDLALIIHKIVSGSEIDS